MHRKQKNQKAGILGARPLQFSVLGTRRVRSRQGESERLPSYAQPCGDSVGIWAPSVRVRKLAPFQGYLIRGNKDETRGIWGLQSEKWNPRQHFLSRDLWEAGFQGITKELDNNEMAFQAIKMINSRLSQSLASRIFHFFVQLTKNRVSNIIFALTFSLFHSNSCLILFSRSPDVIYDPKTVALWPSVSYWHAFWSFLNLIHSWRIFIDF